MSAYMRWKGTVETRGAARPLIAETGDVVLVSRGGWDRWLVFRCPCGCGTELPINLDGRAGPAWRIYHPGPSASLYPSVWRDSGCGAHFILSRGYVWVLAEYDHSVSRATPDERLVAAVRDALGETVVHYYDLSEALGSEPWETLDACRELVRRREAVEERTSRQRGCFRRRHD